jgi:diacylglycerol O-acyltransferase / wax synthase
VERLTAEDLMMLWPDQVWPQDIGALAILNGGNLLDPDGRFRIESVKLAVAARLHRVPRFRQVIYVPPRQLGDPLWVDAQDFDLDDHLVTVSLPPPGDEAQLLRMVEQVRRVRLDRTRPLWEMWFLTGLPNRRVALFVRMHHSIADGMAGVATMATFLDPSPTPITVAAHPWAPQPAPTEEELRDDQRRRRRQRARKAAATLTRPVRSVQQVRGAWPAIREMLADKPLPATSLDHVVGGGRSFALIRSSLGPIKETAHAQQATVNDVLLTGIAGGLRRLLDSRGEPVPGGVLRIYVPVSLHQEPRAEASGNLIGQMVVPLPLGVSDPIRRLQLIAGATASRKARIRPSVGTMPRGGIAGRVFLKLLSRQRVNVASADIPGPEVPLYFAGARLLEVFPLVQLIGTVSLAVGGMSYAGQFNIMVVADQDAYPDLETLAAGTRDDLQAFDALRQPSREPA